MAIKQVVPGLHWISLGYPNVYLLEDGDALVLVDTGLPGQHGRIYEAVGTLGRSPDEIRSILVTHLHADHTGGLADIAERTGATVYGHPRDAQDIRVGKSSRPMQPAKTPFGAVAGALRRMMPAPDITPYDVDEEVRDGDVLPLAGGLEVVHVPGHSAGQVAFLWPEHGGVLIAGDAAGNLFGLGHPPVWEDPEAGRRSLAKLAERTFDVAVFGHGRPIRRDAANAFRRRFG